MNFNVYDQIENDFTYHAPKEFDIQKFQLIRDNARQLAHLFADLVPAGKESAVALTKLNEAVMWANAGIAREKGTHSVGQE